MKPLKCWVKYGYDPGGSQLNSFLQTDSEVNMDMFGILLLQEHRANL